MRIRAPFRAAVLEAVLREYELAEVPHGQVLGLQPATVGDGLADASTADWPTMALVASAGGIDALSRILSALPHDLPASVIALVHVSPDHESSLPHILGRVSFLLAGNGGRHRALCLCRLGRYGLG